MSKTGLGQRRRVGLAECALSAAFKRVQERERAKRNAQKDCGGQEQARILKHVDIVIAYRSTGDI